MSYTPGPWAWGRPEVVAFNKDLTIRAKIADVCFIPGDRRCAIADANSRLIAAAPELLEALEEVINSNPSILATDKSALRYVQAVEKARKVIRKARGEE